MIESVLQPIYEVLMTFFPTALYEQPFFNFLINLLIFAFCCLLFAIFFIYPIVGIFKYIRNTIRRC